MQPQLGIWKVFEIPTESKYTVEYRNFEIGVVPIVLKIWNMKFAEFLSSSKTLPGKVFPQTLAWPEESGVQTRIGMQCAMQSNRNEPQINRRISQ